MQFLPFIYLFSFMFFCSKTEMVTFVHSHPPIRFSTKINHFIPLTPKPIAFLPKLRELVVVAGRLDLAQFNNK